MSTPNESYLVLGKRYDQLCIPELILLIKLVCHR
jgi:hypothetical protein